MQKSSVLLTSVLLIALLASCCESCIPDKKAAEKCGSEGKTRIFVIEGKSNGTHILVFRDLPLKMICCTTPKSNSSQDKDTMLEERKISYRLHNFTANQFLPVVTGGKVNSELDAYNVTITSDNDYCEYMTMNIERPTYSDSGTWTCASRNDDNETAEVSVIVGDDGAVSSVSMGADQYKTMYSNVTLVDYSPVGAMFNWGVAINDGGTAAVNGSGNYLNSTLIVTDLSGVYPPTTISTGTENNIYDAIGGTNYTLHWTRATSRAGLKVAVNPSYHKAINVTMGIEVFVGWKSIFRMNSTATIAGDPTTLPVPTTTTTRTTRTTTRSTVPLTTRPSNTAYASKGHFMLTAGILLLVGAK